MASRRSVPLVGVLVLTLFNLAACASLSLTRAEKETTTRRLLKQLSDLGLWSGVVACSDSAGDKVYQDAYGTASYELMRAPMSPALRTPVAQNAQLMLAVAAHQLQAQGKLNLSAPAAQYINMSDFGAAGQWCPRVRGAAPDAPCEQPTLHQLLAHTGGLWDSRACSNPQDWQAAACGAAATMTGNFTPSFGHDSRDCPNSLCWRCQRPGHMARDCPYGYRAQASWDEAGPAVCLRCGSETCPCAGEKDFVRAGGGCQRDYSSRDLQHVRCYSCGRRGHLSCAAAPAEPAKLSCHNCGQGGHTAAECSREVPHVIRGEQQGGRGFADRGFADRGGGGYYSGGGGGGGGYSSGGGGGGYGGARQPRYESYSAYRDIEQGGQRGGYGGRRYSDPGGYDRYDDYGQQRQYGANKRPRW